MLCVDLFTRHEFVVYVRERAVAGLRSRDETMKQFVGRAQLIVQRARLASMARE